MRKSSLIIEHMDYMDFLRGIPDESVDLVVTDPPYGVNWNQGDMEWGAEAYKPIDGDGSSFSYSDLARESHRILKPDTAAFFFTRWNVFGSHLAQSEREGFTPREPLIIQRAGPSPLGCPNAFAPYSEWAMFLHKGKPQLRETQLILSKSRGLTNKMRGRYRTELPGV